MWLSSWLIPFRHLSQLKVVVLTALNTKTVNLFNFLVLIAIKLRAAQVVNDNDDADNADVANADAEKADVNGNKDASSGRLFMKKFLLFKNMFGSQQQPIIPIIITGGSTGTGTGTGTTPTTTTITSTGTIPTATGTITTEPIEGKRTVARTPSYAPEYQEDDSETEVTEEQALAAVLGNAGEEYVVTDQDIKGTSDAKASRAPGTVNLKRRGQIVSVRIPPKYRRYFQNGQRVVLNRPNGGAKKRRVVSKRPKKNNRKNKNRRRVVAI